MTTITATNARKDFFEIVKGATEKHEIFHIRHRQGDVVLMSEEEYESLIETLALLSTPGFKQGFEKACKEVEADDTTSFEDVFGEPQ
ncbi:MAG: type II toxin-antitoxin system Phd/YefM family antitoxin [Planctomycetota bacterium]|jgi:antitoxin YefM